MDQELPRTCCHKGHNLSSLAVHPDAAEPGWRVYCSGGLGKGTSAVGTLWLGQQVARALTGMGGTAPGPGGLALAGHPPLIGWQHTGSRGMPGGSGPCVHVSRESPWLDRGTGQPHRPRLGHPPGGSGRNPLLRRHWQRQGGNVEGAIV